MKLPESVKLTLGRNCRWRDVDLISNLQTLGTCNIKIIYFISLFEIFNNEIIL